jgi:hypothetical protein
MNTVDIPEDLDKKIFDVQRKVIELNHLNTPFGHDIPSLRDRFDQHEDREYGERRRSRKDQMLIQAYAPKIQLKNKNPYEPRPFYLP